MQWQNLYFVVLDKIVIVLEIKECLVLKKFVEYLELNLIFLNL